MFKRLMLVLALGAALVACSPSGSGTSAAPSVAPIDSALPSVDASESASPS
jgi:hypothetical protein